MSSLAADPAADWSAYVQGAHGVRVQHLQGSDRSLTDQMKVNGQNQRNQERLFLL